jgi:hypothetical protein
MMPGLGKNWASSQFWTGEVESNLAGFACSLLRRAQVLDHAKPLGSAVVSAVYAHDIHSPIQEIVNKVRVVRGCARHGNHDAHIAIRWGFAEGSDSMFLEQNRARVVLVESFLDRSSGPRFARKFMEQSQQSVEGGYHMGL